MWKGQGRSGYGESSTGGDYDDWSCLSRNGRQWKNPSTMLTRDLSGADYWHIRKQMTDSYDVPLEVYAENDTVNLAHTLPNGKANLLAYADRPALVKPKVSIKDKILPQFKRLSVLRNQMLELENSYRSGEMDIKEYSLLRDLIVVKIDRATVLYKKAVSVRPIREETPEDGEESAYESCAVDYSKAAPMGSSSQAPDTHYSANNIPQWITDLPSENSFKSFLIFSCKATKKALHYKDKIGSYINELKAV